MRRKCVIIILLIGLITSALSAKKAEAVNREIFLSFSGNTVICNGTIMASGNIIASLELWQGSTKLISWPGSGNGFVQISETYTVVSGVTYTLKLNGTVNGVSFPEASVTKTCP